ncbi:GDSL esterase/lipase [Forsythia ovata]|uniref:GDSL esterase/lipase n=1 Tax=Forsythia ovata TaxID=205694 RepID=A0ABD1Q326_9LAMI
MANSHQVFSFVGFLFLLLSPISISNALHILPKFPYFDTLNFDKIYQVGDSISDTGNLIRESPIGSLTPFARLPYGETFFKNATGRCSNGLLMIDFIALSSGLPLLKPYKEAEANFSHGVNFAVAGSTALPVETLAAMNILSPVTTSSLDVQLDWMHSHFNSTCQSHTDCAEKNANSLFMVGEIGGNDYNYALFQGKSIQELKDMVPQIVDTIANAVRRVIRFGATRVVVPGNFPIGCLPIYLTGFQTNDSTSYDQYFHCLKDLNNFSMYHNDHLQQAIEELKIEHPNTTIIYGDYYNAFMWVLSRAQLLGFDSKSLQKACCGSGGAYNFNMTKMCGFPGVSFITLGERSRSGPSSSPLEIDLEALVD